MKRKFFFVAAVIAACVVFTGNAASARPGGTTTTRTSLLATIGVAATSSDNSVCSQIVIFGVQNWQCTPVLAATGTAFHPLVSMGGSLSWSGFATCEYRKHADGFNNSWGPWTSCGPFSKSASGSRSWGLLAAPGSGTLVLQWPRITNAETAFATDCVEIRTSISTNATASNLLESVSTSSRFPSSGTNLSGVCEGGSPY